MKQAANLCQNLLYVNSGNILILKTIVPLLCPKNIRRHLRITYSTTNGAFQPGSRKSFHRSPAEGSGAALIQLTHYPVQQRETVNTSRIQHQTPI